MRRVLVTGANGHVGTELVRALLKDGVEVAVYVRPGSDSSSLAGLPLERFLGDLGDVAALSAAGKGCDVLFHLAAPYTLWAPDPQDIIKPMEVGIRSVMCAAARTPGARVVFVSSVAAVGYSRSAVEVRTEKDWNRAAKNPYYQGKVQSEQAAQRLSRELGVPVVTVSPAVILGPGPPRLTPSMEYLRQLLHGTGVTHRGGLNLVHVTDVAQGLMAAAVRGVPGQRYILGGENLTYQRLGALVAELTGTTPRHLRAPRAVLLAAGLLDEARFRLTGRPCQTLRSNVHEVVDRFGWFDCSKARTELQYSARGARDTVRDAARWLASAGLAPALVGLGPP